MIDDNRSCQLLVQETLKGVCRIKMCDSYTNAKIDVEKDLFDLILLDVMLPDGDGFQFLTLLRESGLNKSTPVLFLTAKTGISDQLMGFKLGADDYITKPFNPTLLKARIEAKLKQLEKQQKTEITVGNLRIDVQKQKTTILTADHETEIELTPTEFKILSYLASHEEMIFSRDQIISHVWGENIHVIDRTIDSHISHLRKKMAGSTHGIEAVQNSGYRLKKMKESSLVA